MKRFMKRVLIALVLVCGVIGWFFYVFIDLEDRTYSFATLRSSHGYKFNIRLPLFAEGAVRLSCKVMIDGQTVFSGRIGYIRASDVRKVKFVLLEGGEDLDVIAIVEQANPQIVIAIYDVKNRLSGQGNPKVAKQLLKRLEQSLGQSLFWPGEFDEVEPRVYH